MDPVLRIRLMGVLCIWISKLQDIYFKPVIFQKEVELGPILVLNTDPFIGSLSESLYLNHKQKVP